MAIAATVRNKGKVSTDILETTILKLCPVAGEFSYKQPKINCRHVPVFGFKPHFQRKLLVIGPFYQELS